MSLAPPPEPCASSGGTVSGMLEHEGTRLGWGKRVGQQSC